MINFYPFELVRERYSDQETPFLNQLRTLAQEKKIYQGLTILHNTPLTIEAVLKIEILLLGGAEVTVSCIRALPPSREALDILNSAKVEVQLSHHFKKIYDFHLDCCGELLDIHPPKIGAVELTQTGSALYKKANCLYPAVSVDDSPLKLLETLLGTGDGFLRALIYKFGHNIYNKKFILFGFGKVGQGIAYALKKFTNKIVVIDKSEAAMRTALQYGVKFIKSTDREAILEELQDSAFVVCATGIKNLITDFYSFHKFDFNEAMLINMGAYDEYGDHFSEQEVVFAKKPFNFSISEPTAIKYLDPIFYAHNLGIELILTKQVDVGYHPFPNELASKILKKWSMLYKEEFFEIAACFH